MRHHSYRELWGLTKFNKNPPLKWKKTVHESYFYKRILNSTEMMIELWENCSENLNEKSIEMAARPPLLSIARDCLN